MIAHIDDKTELMIIDDDEDDRYLLRKVLSEVASQVCVSEFGDALLAYQSLAERTFKNKTLPRLVLVDLNMPLFNGFDFLEAARQLSELAALPLVVYTTSSADEDILKSYQLGANAYMVKPLSYDGITDMLASTINYWLKITHSIQIRVDAKETMDDGINCG